MEDILSYIIWNPDLFAFKIGSFGVRWYSICWGIGLVLAFFIVKRLYKEQKIADKYFDRSSSTVFSASSSVPDWVTACFISPTISSHRGVMPSR
jgi:hypothetical protein